MDPQELEDINKARAVLGFKPLKLRDMRCMMCGKSMMRYNKTAHCDKCAERITRRGENFETDCETGPFRCEEIPDEDKDPGGRDLGHTRRRFRLSKVQGTIAVRAVK
jgi:hypothetical protein